MRTISVGFSKPIKPTWFSRLISFLEKTEYDHVFVKWNWTAINRDVIYQASHLAVNFESNVTFDSHATVLEEYEVQLTEQTHKDIMQFCMDNSDKPYGIKEIFGFLWVRLGMYFNVKFRNPFPTYNSSFVCSKIVADILVLSGSLKLDVSPDEVYPLLLNQIIQKAGLKRLK